MSKPILVTREQAAERCQVSPPKLDEWSVLPGFPIIRGPHFVRIHLRLLDEWLGELASQTNPSVRYEPNGRKVRR